MIGLGERLPSTAFPHATCITMRGTMTAVTATAAEARPEVPLSAAELSAIAGLYWNARDASARRFIVEGGHLKLRTSPQQTITLKSIGSRRFVPTDPLPILLVFDANRVTFEREAGPADTFERVEPFAPTPAQLEAFTGIYRSDEIDTNYRIVVKDGALRLERLKSTPSVLEPLVTDTFSGQAGVMRFTRDAKNAVTGFVLEAGRVLGMKFWKETAPARRSSEQ
jgi:hypothetical protein